MNKLWQTFGYSTWKYSKDLWCLCGPRDYIWIYKNEQALREDLKSIRYYGYGNNYSPGMHVLQVNGPCGVITI